MILSFRRIFYTILCPKFLVPLLFAEYYAVTININIFVPKLHSSTTMKKVQFFLFWNAPLSLHVLNTTKYIKSTGILDFKWHIKYPDDNVEKFCEESREFPNVERCQIFPIINPRRKWFIFIPMNFSRYKEGTCERRILRTVALYWFQLFFTDKYVYLLGKLRKSDGNGNLGQTIE